MRTKFLNEKSRTFNENFVPNWSRNLSIVLAWNLIIFAFGKDFSLWRTIILISDYVKTHINVFIDAYVISTNVGCALMKNPKKVSHVFFFSFASYFQCTQVYTKMSRSISMALHWFGLTAQVDACVDNNDPPQRFNGCCATFMFLVKCLCLLNCYFQWHLK